MNKWYKTLAAFVSLEDEEKTDAVKFAFQLEHVIAYYQGESSNTTTIRLTYGEEAVVAIPFDTFEKIMDDEG